MADPRFVVLTDVAGRVVSLGDDALAALIVVPYRPGGSSTTPPTSTGWTDGSAWDDAAHWSDDA